MNHEKYMEGVLQTESSDMNVIMERLSYIKTVRLLHSAMGMVTEAAEILDVLKKHIYYGKPIDEVNLIEEFGDSDWYKNIGMAVLGTNQLVVWQKNREKLLGKRYKEGKFTEEAAVNRDLKAEREALEDKWIEIDLSDLKEIENQLPDDACQPVDCGDKADHEGVQRARKEAEKDIKELFKKQTNDPHANRLTKDIIKFILKNGDVTPRYLEKNAINFAATEREMRIAIQRALSIFGILEITDDLKLGIPDSYEISGEPIHCGNPCPCPENKTNFNISEEELEYQMKPSLEGDMYYDNDNDSE